MAHMDWRRLADYVVDARVARGLRTREALAEQVGISSRVLSDIENARRTNYDRVTMAALERALGWGTGSVARVLTGGEPLPRAGSSPAGNAEAIVAAIVRVLDEKMSDYHKVRIIRGIIAEDYRPAVAQLTGEEEQRLEAG